MFRAKSRILRFSASGSLFSGERGRWFFSLPCTSQECLPSELVSGAAVGCSADSGEGVISAGVAVSTVGEGSRADSGEGVTNTAASASTMGVDEGTGASVTGGA